MSAVAENPDQVSAAPPLRHSLRDQIDFLKDFWVAPENKWKARLMLGAILTLTVAEIALTAGVGLGFQAALNALVAKQAMTFAVTGGATVAGIAASAVSANGREYITSNLGQNWRGWLTKQFNSAWLEGKSYLKLQHSKKYTQNPDQRIAETIGNVTGSTLSLTLGLFHSVVGIGIFSAMLWHISPILVGAAVVCSLGAHAATHWAGSSLGRIWQHINDTEAKFRHALTRVRDNAKVIALTGMEPVEDETLTREFGKVDKNRRDLFKANAKTGIVGWMNMSSVSIVPIALSAPKFFAGTATIGGLELTRQAYTQFYFALSWFPQSYTAIANWTANVNQLMEFKKDLDANKADITERRPPVETKTPAPVVAKPKAPAGPAP